MKIITLVIIALATIIQPISANEDLMRTLACDDPKHCMPFNNQFKEDIMRAVDIKICLIKSTTRFSEEKKEAEILIKNRLATIKPIVEYTIKALKAEQKYRKNNPIKETTVDKKNRENLDRLKKELEENSLQIKYRNEKLAFRLFSHKDNKLTHMWYHIEKYSPFYTNNEEIEKQIKFLLAEQENLKAQINYLDKLLNKKDRYQLRIDDLTLINRYMESPRKYKRYLPNRNYNCPTSDYGLAQLIKETTQFIKKYDRFFVEFEWNIKDWK